MTISETVLNMRKTAETLYLDCEIFFRGDSSTSDLRKQLILSNIDLIESNISTLRAVLQIPVEVTYEQSNNLNNNEINNTAPTV